MLVNLSISLSFDQIFETSIPASSLTGSEPKDTCDYIIISEIILGTILEHHRPSCTYSQSQNFRALMKGLAFSGVNLNQIHFSLQTLLPTVRHYGLFPWSKLSMIQSCNICFVFHCQNTKNKRMSVHVPLSHPFALPQTFFLVKSYLINATCTCIQIIIKQILQDLLLELLELCGTV